MVSPAKQILILLSGFLAGCTAETAPLPAASGQVVTAEGEPLSRGLIEFKSRENDRITVSSPINDGAFSLITLTASARSPGAPPGTYDVVIVPGDPGSQEASGTPPQPVKLPDVVTIPESGNPDLEFTLPE